MSTVLGLLAGDCLTETWAAARSPSCARRVVGSDLNHRASSNPAKGNEEKLGLPEVRPGGGHLEMGGLE